MATPQLNITHITASQNNKETTANVAFDALDNAMNGLLDKGGTGNFTMTDAEFRACQVIRVTGLHASAFTIRIPDGIPKLFTVWNNTSQLAVVETENAASIGAEIAAFSQGIFYTDGAEVVQLGAAVTPTSYDLGIFIAGVPDGDEQVLRYLVVTPFSLPLNCVGSYATAGSSSTGVQRISLRKNGTEFGYAEFNASSSGTFASSATSFVAGDRFSIYCDPYADADTLADISLTFKGTRA